MSTHRHIDAICIAVILLTVALTLLFMNGEAYGLQVIVDEDAESYSGFSYFTENDRDGSWNTGNATEITLQGDHATVSGAGAYAYDGNVMITSAGKYVLSGTLENGSVIVDTDGSAKVWVMLNGVTVSCMESACLDIEQADKVFMTLAEGTENSLIMTGLSDAAKTSGVDGALFSRDDLSINGTGSLTVTAETGHGIVGNDELVITGGRISVTAAEDAVHVNDSFRMTEADLVLCAGDDGISVTEVQSSLYLESGSLAITAGDKGIAAENTVEIVDGTIDIEAADDGISAAGDFIIHDGKLNINTADDGIHSDAAVTITGGEINIPRCYEGIEAVTIDVTGGDITIYPEDDGLNANGGSGGFGNFGGKPGGMGGGGHHNGMNEARPTEGTGMERPTWMTDGELPEGMEKPQDWTETDMEGPPMPEGMEQMERPSDMPMEMTDGQPQGAPTEDVNAAGSTLTDQTQETWIHISGGNITVINQTARDADGLDSNGDIIISGGVIRVSLTNSGSNSALDYGSESGGIMEISGGEVIACGSYSMAEGFDDSSTQCAILYNIKRGAAAGTMIALEDNEGNILLEYEAPCSFSSVALSCPEMKLGETYTIVIGDSVEEITLDTVSASFGDAQSEGFGGPMNWGRMTFRPEA